VGTARQVLREGEREEFEHAARGLLFWETDGWLAGACPVAGPDQYSAVAGKRRLALASNPASSPVKEIEVVAGIRLLAWLRCSCRTQHDLSTVQIVRVLPLLFDSLLHVSLSLWVWPLRRRQLGSHIRQTTVRLLAPRPPVMATDVISFLFTGLDDYAVGLEGCELAVQVQAWRYRTVERRLYSLASQPATLTGAGVGHH
jgi:hypothetical protein